MWHSLLNLSQKSYSRIECGQVRIAIDRYIKIAKVLNVDPVEMFNENVLSLQGFEQLDYARLQRQIKELKDQIRMLSDVVKISKPGS